MVVSWGEGIYATGCGRRGQTGLGGEEERQHAASHLTEIPELRGMGVSMAACGEDFTIVATDKRAWGFGNGSKLGLGWDVGGRGGGHPTQPSSVRDCFKPSVISGIDPPIRKVVCGWGHTLLLSDHQVMSWGWNLHGQCGLGHKEFVSVPQPVRALAGTDIVDIAAGSTHSVALTQAGEVFIWGSYADGKLGLGEDHKGDMVSPCHLDAFDGLRVIQLAAGPDHTAVITEDRGLYLWGFGQHGALGFVEGTNEPAPRRLTTLSGKVEAVTCGMDITLAHYAGDLT